jgi:hypothetical protein
MKNAVAAERGQRRFGRRFERMRAGDSALERSACGERYSQLRSRLAKAGERLEGRGPVKSVIRLGTGEAVKIAAMAILRIARQEI